jgi:hypothetical protein
VADNQKPTTLVGNKVYIIVRAQDIKCGKKRTKETGVFPLHDLGNEGYFTNV